jgi:hypothetical protein
MKDYTLERKYFELRKEQEDELDKLKRNQNKIKKKATNDIACLSGVSITRVNHAITLMKKLTLLSIEKQIDDTFALLLSNLERSFIRHYQKNELKIKSYIETIFTLQRELMQFRKEKKKIFNDFKKILSKNNIDTGMLNSSYLEYKTAVKYITSEDITLEEYHARKKKYSYINEIANDFISYECERLEEKRKANIELEKQEELYLIAVNDMFGFNKDEKSSEEKMIMDILTNMDIDI